MPTSRLLTADEYSQVREDGLSELVRGRTHRVDFPTPRHSISRSTTDLALSSWCRAASFGYVLARCGVVTERDPDTVRRPDCLVVSRDRLPNGLDDGWFEKPPPNLVVEVLDDGEQLADVLEKVGEYLQLGIDEVWIVDPSERWVERHRPDEPSRRLGVDERLADLSVLPGFAADVAAFFAGI